MEHELFQQDAPLLPAIVGPTACGKTDLSLKVAASLSCEIISGDSMQVYKGMDIGTAKLPFDQRQGIPHHLLDIVPPEQPFSVADFREAAIAAAQDIYSRGKTPLLVGGTGLYIASLFRPYNFSAEYEPDPELRLSLLEQWQKDQGRSLHQQLKAIDPEAAERIHPHDQRRLFRALEVYHNTDRTITSMQEEKVPAAFRPIIIGLTCERERLYQRIDERVLVMIKDGLVAEVQGLLDRGLSPEAVSMQGLGYRQIASYLAGNITLEEAIEIIQRDTRRFAKRQWTWFRHEPDIRWFALEDYREEGALERTVSEYLSQRLKEA